MPMSRDRVKFNLPPRYFQRGCPRAGGGFSDETMQTVLLKAFGMSKGQSARLMDEHPQGFTIISRPSQFARFIVLRYEADEGINGIKDLEPCIVPASEFDQEARFYAEKAKLANVSVDAMRRAARALGWEGDLHTDDDWFVDVSKNPHGEPHHGPFPPRHCEEEL